MGNNRMATKEAGKAIGKALANNSVLKELDLSNNNWKTNSWDRAFAGDGFGKELADGLSANGTLETIIFGNSSAVTMNTSMIEADFSGKELGASEAIIIAAFLPKCR